MKSIYNLALLGLAILVGPSFAFAEAAQGSSGLVGIAAGLAIGLVGLGGTLSQGRAVSSALNSVGRNPSAAGKLTVPLFVGMALIESLVILSFLVAGNLVEKL